METESHECRGNDSLGSKKSGAFGTLQQKVQTGAIYYCNLCLGITMTFLAPALIEFAKMFDTDMKNLSVIVSIGKAICLFSSLAFGYLYGRANRHIIVTILLAAMSVMLIVIPYSKNLVVFGILLTILGAAAGGYAVAQVVWVIDIWKYKAGPWVQGQYFFVALGNIIPPTVFAPFLEVKSHGVATNETATKNGTMELSAGPSKVTIPTLICAGIMGIGALLLLISFLAFRKHQRTIPDQETESEGENLKKSDTSSKCNYGMGTQRPEGAAKFRNVMLIALSSALSGSVMCMELAANEYLPVYSHYSGFTASEAEGARVLVAFSTTFTIARLAGVLVSMKLDAKFILCCNMVVVTIANAMVLISSEYGKKEFIWLGLILLAVGLSSSLPTIFTFMSLHVEMTNMVGSIMVVVRSLVATACPIVIGSYIETSANVILYLNLIAISFGIVAFVCMHVLTRRAE